MQQVSWSPYVCLITPVPQSNIKSGKTGCSFCDNVDNKEYHPPFNIVSTSQQKGHATMRAKKKIVYQSSYSIIKLPLLPPSNHSSEPIQSERCRAGQPQFFDMCPRTHIEFTKAHLGKHIKITTTCILKLKTLTELSEWSRKHNRLAFNSQFQNVQSAFILRNMLMMIVILSWLIMSISSLNLKNSCEYIHPQVNIKVLCSSALHVMPRPTTLCLSEPPKAYSVTGSSKCSK